VHVRTDILSGLLDISGDIESIARSLGDGQTVVERDTAWDGTESAVLFLLERKRI
jgi:hypothetical protein